MFSGIVEEIGKIKALQYKDKVLNLSIEAKVVLGGTKKGDSIAVNGACLTVVDIKRGFFIAQAIGETLQRTNLGALKVSNIVNLERALKVSDRISGHFVSGHVDRVCSVKNIVKNPSSLDIYFSAPDDFLQFFVEKGSVAVNGVSLTVSAIKPSSFAVAVIPHTMKNTNLVMLKAGDKVNIEADIFGKYIIKYLSRTASAPSFGGKNIISNLIDMTEGGDLACN
ncbi:MAG: riboflavin synthase [Candidatus Margulisiibacteriota bacterium]